MEEYGKEEVTKEQNAGSWDQIRFGYDANNHLFRVEDEYGDSDNKVYYGMEDGVAEYVGITKQDVDVRLQQHSSPSNPHQKNFDVLDVYYEGLTGNQSRAVEQWEIENGPSHQNISNSISKDHRYYDAAKAWAAKNKDNYRKG